MTWGKSKTKIEKMLEAILTPWQIIYFIGYFLRLNAYQLGFLPAVKLNVPVISIGNLTVGGTGKTPVCIDLAKYFVSAGYHVGILSRGFHRKSKEEIVIVSDGKNMHAQVEDTGDEAFLIAQAVPEAVVIVSKNRFQAGNIAINNFHCNLLILDDGFQHLQLKKNLDIVLWDYADNPKELKLLPAGRLREPLSALRRANHIIITKVPSSPDNKYLDMIYNVLKQYNKQAKISMCSFETESVVFAQGNKAADLINLLNKKILAFCGIACPESFQTSLLKTGAKIAALRIFPDHHWYSNHELKALAQEFRVLDCQFCLCTQKDLCRLPQSFRESIPLAVLKQKINWQENIYQSINNHLNNKQNYYQQLSK